MPEIQNIQNTPISPNPALTSQEDEQAKKLRESKQMLGDMTAGIGTAWGISKGVDMLVLSGKQNNGTKSLLGRLVAKIDKWTGTEGNIGYRLEKGIDSIKNKISVTKTRLSNSPRYREITRQFKEGTTIKSKLINDPLEKQLRDHIQDNIKKIKKGKLAEITPIRHDIRLSTRPDLFEKMKKRAADFDKVKETRFAEKAVALTKEGKEKGLSEKAIKRTIKELEKSFKQTEERLKNAVNQAETRVSQLTNNPVSVSQLKTNLEEARKGLKPITKLGPVNNIAENLRNNADDAIAAIQKNGFNTGRIGKEISKIQILNSTKSRLGRLFSRVTIGTGNYFGIGLNTLVTGVVLGMSINSAKKAEKGEKFSSFMEDIMGGWLGGFLLWPRATKYINGAGNALGRLGGSSLTQRALRNVGNVVAQGKFKGVPRLILVMAALVPVSATFRKVSHMIFGNPIHTKEKQKNANKQNNENIIVW